MQYCGKMNIKEPFKASFANGMAFLSELFHNEKGNYGIIAVAKSALSAVLPKQGNVTFRKDSNVSRMLTGIFKLRQSLPKHVVTYDPNIVLKYMDPLPTNKDLSLELLTKKLRTLLCFLSGQRIQSIGKLKIDKSILSHGTCTFYFDTVLKTTKPGNHQHPLVFNTYAQNSKLCIIDCLQEYRCRTDLVRENLDGNSQELILSYAYPFKPINSQSIARYVKLFLAMEGIDITVFTTHFVRSASTSKAKQTISDF